MRVTKVTTREAAPPVSVEDARLLKIKERQLAELAGIGLTHELPDEARPLVPDNLQTPFGIATDSADVFLALPVASTRRHPAGIRWRVELRGLLPGGKPVGLDILGDIILGRGSSPTCLPDLDLDPFGAESRGVSRQHALLRPTRHSLYVIDLQSKNGTKFNAFPLSYGTARALGDDSTITLGSFSFQARILERPR